MRISQTILLMVIAAIVSMVSAPSLASPDPSVGDMPALAALEESKVELPDVAPVGATEGELFALAVAEAKNKKGRPCNLPLKYGRMVYALAQLHNVDPYEMGGYLCAEHDPGFVWREDLEGRYNCTGDRCEMGVAQLKKVWANRAYLRCNFKRPYYAGLPECLYIPRGVRVVRKAKARHIRKGRAVHLADARVNLEALAIAFHYVRIFYNRNARNQRAVDPRSYLRCTLFVAMYQPNKCWRAAKAYEEWAVKIRGERLTLMLKHPARIIAMLKQHGVKLFSEDG